jgi:hypothetical protein
MFLIIQLAFTVTLKFSIDLWLSWPTYKECNTKCQISQISRVTYNSTQNDKSNLYTYITLRLLYNTN